MFFYQGKQLKNDQPRKKLQSSDYDNQFEIKQLLIDRQHNDKKCNM